MAQNFPILLVDDNPLLIDILERASIHSFPEASFIQVLSCEEAQTYLESLHGVGPLLLLLDLDLGKGTSGLSLLSYLQAHSSARLLPVIILTISDLSADIYESYQLGATSFTVKPFDFPDWKVYLTLLREYWFKTATLPRIFFHGNETDHVS